MDKLAKKFKILLGQLLLLLFFSPVIYAQDLVEIFLRGEKAFSEGKYLLAAKLFDQVLEKDSDNYKVLRAQADTKVKLKKLKEAEDLLNRILDMPESKGRTILIFAKGETNGRKAELVDETVMALSLIHI